MAESRRDHCCVPQCNGNAQRHKDLSFHTFPKDKNRRKRWIWQIRRDVGRYFQINDKKTVVCSRHFKKDDFKWSAGSMNGKRLKPGTEPTIFPWSNEGELETSRSNPLNCIRQDFHEDDISEEEEPVPVDTTRRGDREPTNSSRICSCHFPNGDKKNNPTQFERNKNSWCQWPDHTAKRRKRKPDGSFEEPEPEPKPKRAPPQLEEHNYQIRPENIKLKKPDKPVEPLEPLEPTPELEEHSNSTCPEMEESTRQEMEELTCPEMEESQERMKALMNEVQGVLIRTKMENEKLKALSSKATKHNESTGADALVALSAVNKLMEETLSYYSGGRFSLQATWIRDESGRIFSPEVASHILHGSNPLQNMTTTNPIVIEPILEKHTPENASNSPQNSTENSQENPPIDSPEDAMVAQSITAEQTSQKTGTAMKKTPGNFHDLSEPPAKKSKTEKEEGLDLFCEKENEMEDPMKNFTSLGTCMLDYLHQERITKTPSHAKTVLDLCHSLTETAVKCFSLGRHSVHTLWIRDSWNRVVRPVVAQQQLPSPVAPPTPFVLLPCPACPVCEPTQHDLDLHMHMYHTAALLSRRQPNPHAAGKEQGPSLKLLKPSCPVESTEDGGDQEESGTDGGAIDRGDGVKDRGESAKDMVDSAIDRVDSAIDKGNGAKDRGHGAKDRGESSKDRGHGAKDRMDSVKERADDPTERVDKAHHTKDRAENAEDVVGKKNVAMKKRVKILAKPRGTSCSSVNPAKSPAKIASSLGKESEVPAKSACSLGEQSVSPPKTASSLFKVRKAHGKHASLFATESNDPGKSECRVVKESNTPVENASVVVKDSMDPGISAFSSVNESKYLGEGVLVCRVAKESQSANSTCSSVKESNVPVVIIPQGKIQLESIKDGKKKIVMIPRGKIQLDGMKDALQWHANSWKKDMCESKTQEKEGTESMKTNKKEGTESMKTKNEGTESMKPNKKEGTESMKTNEEEGTESKKNLKEGTESKKDIKKGTESTKASNKEGTDSTKANKKEVTESKKDLKKGTESKKDIKKGTKSTKANAKKGTEHTPMLISDSEESETEDRKDTAQLTLMKVVSQNLQQNVFSLIANRPGPSKEIVPSIHKVQMPSDKNMTTDPKTRANSSDSDSDMDDIGDWSDEPVKIKIKREPGSDSLLQFVCSVCSSWEEVYDGGLGHYKDVHKIDLEDTRSSNQWPCLFCFSLFVSNRELLEHISGFHHRVEHWHCVFCDGVFLTTERFVTHLLQQGVMRTRDHHPQPSGGRDSRGRDSARGRDSWKCTQCDHTHTDPSSPQQLLDHLNDTHLSEPVAMTLDNIDLCPRCHKTKIWGNERLGYKDNQDKRLSHQDKRLSHGCQQDNQDNRLSQQVMSHQDNQDKKPSQQDNQGNTSLLPAHLQRVCLACDERFCTGASLIEHQVNAHGPSSDPTSLSWTCVVCGQRLSNRGSLQRHLATVHATESWPCRRCGKEMQAKRFLVNHCINLHHMTEREAKVLANEIEALQLF